MMKSVKGLMIVLMYMCAATGFGLTISMTGTNQAADQDLINFMTNNFSNVDTVNYADYSNPANIPAGTDIFMVGRNLSSNSFRNAANSATFNALTIPIVCFTSYIARPDTDRWGWHSGGAVAGLVDSGSETTVTAAGASIFGVAEGTYDFITNAGTGWAFGDGTVGTGNILAAVGLDGVASPGVTTGILAAGWLAGEQSAMGAVFGGNRLLWNVFQTPTLAPDTAAGKQALINVLEYYTDLQAIPEPAAMVILGLGALLIRRKQ